MKTIITFLILMWVGLIISSQVMGNDLLKCNECQISNQSDKDFLMIEEFGGIGQFFYNDKKSLIVEHKGHSYIPVLLEHSETCPYCLILQSDGRTD